jgi:general secretion pathway protein D
MEYGDSISLPMRIQALTKHYGISQIPGIKALTSSMPVGLEALAKFLALGATINIYKTNGAAQILSEPSVLCTNNKPSEIYVGQVRWILISTAAGDNQNDNARNNYSREDIGITLKVKPRLSSNNKVALEVEANIEDVDLGDTASVDRPTTTKRKVTTNAIVSNGQTIILGGLIKSTNGKSIKKVPILGDIPLLGLLFKSTSKDVRKINVVIYLTPYIVRRSSDLIKLKEFLNDLNGVQSQFNEKVRQRLHQSFRSQSAPPPSRYPVPPSQAPSSAKRHNRAMEILQGRTDSESDQ